MPTCEDGRSGPGARRAEIFRPTTSAENRGLTTFYDDVPTAAAATVELQKAEERAQRVLAAHGMKWPLRQGFASTEALMAYDMLENLCAARHAAASGEIALTLYYAFRAGRDSHAMLIEQPRVRRLIEIGRKSIAGAQQSRLARRFTIAQEHCLIVKRYNELQRMYDKAEVAKLKCAREFGISRSTLCRYLAKEKRRKSSLTNGK